MKVSRRVRRIRAGQDSQQQPARRSVLRGGPSPRAAFPVAWTALDAAAAPSPALLPLDSQKLTADSPQALRRFVVSGLGGHTSPPAVTEVLAAQGFQALSQGAVQAGLGPLPRRLKERGEELPEQTQQEGVADQLGADDARVHRIGGDPSA